MKDNFNEDDYKKITEFLNFVAKNAKFKVNTHEVIQYFGLLSHMQKEILPKVEKHILEVLEVHNNEEGKK